MCDTTGDCMMDACCPMPANDCGPCPPCAPCSVPEAYAPCLQSCTPNACNAGDVCNTCCYQQPPRTRPILPTPCLGRSNAPMETDTIYKRSYFGNFGNAFRPQPIRPCNNLARSNDFMEKCTIQRLSYLPPNVCCKVGPIRPTDNGLCFRGPLYAMTSQKHDYVPKSYSKRCPIRPPNSLATINARLENCTINRLSYLPNDVCRHPPPKPIRQGTTYIPPTGPIEKCTVQKLSYLPVCPAPKEPMPWAEKIRCPPLPYQNCCTVYNLSYLPNCNVSRTAAIKPIEGLNFLGTESGDGCTVYKLSYMPLDASCCRPQPIRPVGGLCMPDGPMEKCTVHRLSYLPNCVERTKPIRPQENCIKPTGPLYAMTTQKHDFVPKPASKRCPILPLTNICRPTAGLERCTINRLSYMPVDLCQNPRPQPIRPPAGITVTGGPIEKNTTYKLSYLPNCPTYREPTPWANQNSIVKSTAPMEKCTIQRLSYGPPGTFNRCGDCCTTTNESPYPRAGIC